MGVEIRDFSLTAAKEQGANEIALPGRLPPSVKKFFAQC
jgi:hypothetical protein